MRDPDTLRPLTPLEQVTLEAWEAEHPEFVAAIRTRPAPAAIDYRALLVKYIAHVGYEEGAVYIPTYNRDLFSDAEEAELRALAQESNRFDPRNQFPKVEPASDG